MTYKIPIARSTVQRNPDAGRQTYIEEGHRATVTVCFKLPCQNRQDMPLELAEKILGESGRLCSIKTVGTNLCSVDGLLATVEDIADFEVRARSKGVCPKDMMVNIELHYQEIHSMFSEPSYFFLYETTQLKCSHCNYGFPHTELETDVIDDGEGGEIYLTDMCPHCGASRCCDYEFEKLSQDQLAKLADTNEIVV